MAEEVNSASNQKKEDWMNSKWRPMMGWMYMLVCIMDFVGFPVLWSLLQSASNGNVSSQWQPLTLQGAGLFHIAMGAVLGLAAYGRTQEKLGGANNGGITLPSNVGTTYQAPVSIPQPVSAGVDSSVANSWGSQPLGRGSSFGGTSPFGATSVPSPVVTGFGGRPAPAPVTDYPER